MSAVRDMARFVAAATAGPAGLTVELRAGGETATFALDAGQARALADLLAAYRDPDDHGRCPSCGAPLDRDLHCVACGHVDGVFGQALAAHAESVRRREERPGPPVAQGVSPRAPAAPRR